ncbi:MAG: CdiI family contact-dependent growth inhibition immunity protein [Endomicrobium sp.]|jgi:hypothetical protein|nr:CdiI family contact-dependent growth inhibition immunity protein [Endomicrobium sp.]
MNKLMSNEKRGAVRCNQDFLYSEGDKWCGYGGYCSTKGTINRCNIDCANEGIGIAINDSLSKSFHLEYSKEIMESFKNESSLDIKEQFRYLQQKYGYKKETDLYRNMMSCSLELSKWRLEITPTKQVRGGWNGIGKKFHILLKSNSPTELIGAAARFAFTRCQGKGRDIVVNALFPNGEPDSLERYLESVDINYQNWLISA